jgi:hypothetical protein
MQVTLIPRGQARGLTWFVPGEDPTLISKQQIFARIVGALGGRAAEEVIFGDAEVTTGASSDLQQVCLPYYSFSPRKGLQNNEISGRDEAASVEVTLPAPKSPLAALVTCRRYAFQIQAPFTESAGQSSLSHVSLLYSPASAGSPGKHWQSVAEW